MHFITLQGAHQAFLRCDCTQGRNTLVLQVPLPCSRPYPSLWITRGTGTSLCEDVVFLWGEHAKCLELFEMVRLSGMQQPLGLVNMPVLDVLLPPALSAMSNRFRSVCPSEAPLQAALCWLVDQVLVAHYARGEAVHAIADCGYLLRHLSDLSADSEADNWDELELAKKAAERGLFVQFAPGSGIAEHFCSRAFVLGIEEVPFRTSGFVLYGWEQVHHARSL